MAKSFAQNLRYFRANFFLRTFALFLRMKRNFSFAQFFIYSIHKKILTYEYDNYYTTLNWLLPVTKSLN